jgi:hypothetical protein
MVYVCMVYAVVEMVITIQYVDLTTLYRHSDSPTMTRARADTEFVAVEFS